MSRQSTQLLGSALVGVPGHPMADEIEVLGRYLEHLPACAYVVEPIGESWSIVYVNTAFRMHTRLSMDTIGNRALEDWTKPSVAKNLRSNFAVAIQERSQMMYREQLDLPYGSDWWRTTIVPVFNVEGECVRIVGLSMLITADQQQAFAVERERDQLAFVAGLDPLTDIGNRRVFFHQAEIAVLNLQEKGESFCLVLLDIDRFKHVNDKQGHNAGDDILQAIGRSLKRLQTGVIVARVGGDEFGIVMPKYSSKQAARFVEPILPQLSDVCRPIAEITLCAGIAEAKSGEPIHVTFARADRALYRAKQSGFGGNVAISK